MKLEELLKKLAEMEGGDEMVSTLNEELSKRNKESEKHRKQKSELNSLIAEIMSTAGVEDKTEVVDKVSNQSSEVKMLMKKVEEMQSTLESEKQAKKKAELSSKISDVLSNKKVQKNVDYHKNALLNLVIEGESGLLVGEDTLEDYVQKMIDEDSTIVSKKKTKETQNGSSDLFSSDELDNLTEDEMSNPDVMDKVNRSLEALG